MDRRRPSGKKGSAYPPERLPDDWTATTLGQLAAYINGYPFKPEDWGKRGLPIIRIAQMTDPAAGSDRYSGTVSDRYLIDDGDLLFSWSATLMTLIWDRGPAYVNQHLFKVVPQGGTDLSFLHHLLDFKLEALAGQTHGTTMKHIKRSDLLPFPVVIPATEEQHWIAEILDTLDAAIRRTEKLIAKLQQMKQGLLHDLLTRGIDDNGEVRDPERQPDLFKRGPLGALPATWRVATLGDLVRECGGFIQTGPFGSQLHAYEYVTEGVPVVMPQDIDGDRFNETRISRISERRAADLARHRLRRNDTVFARRGDLSRCAPVSATEEGWLCGTGCLLVRIPQSGLAGEWLAAVYRHDSGQRQVLARAVGSTMVNLNTTILSSLTIPIPPAREQRNVIKRVNELTSRTFSEEDLLRKLQVIKSGLSDDLLTGRVRVNKLLEGNAA